MDRRKPLTRLAKRLAGGAQALSLVHTSCKQVEELVKSSKKSRDRRSNSTATRGANLIGYRDEVKKLGLETPDDKDPSFTSDTISFRSHDPLSVKRNTWERKT